jgi:hypothetical protein
MSQAKHIFVIITINEGEKMFLEVGRFLYDELGFENGAMTVLESLDDLLFCLVAVELIAQHLAAAALYLVNDSLFGDGAYIYSLVRVQHLRQLLHELFF